MCTTLSIQFLAGRYHATGWDHQVNEGTTEWPPSPWRVLRAIVSAAHRGLSDPGEIGPIVEQLASALPSYVLPTSTEHHTRHYMPTDKSPTKIFDTFRVLEGGVQNPSTMRISWPDVALGLAERALLTEVLRSVGYLGRSQSWVEVTLDGEGDKIQSFNCSPTEGEGGPCLGSTRVLAPMVRAEYEAWFDKLDKKGREFAPKSTWEVLNQTTALLRKRKWTEAPGSRWVSYTVDTAKPKRWRTPTPQPVELQAVVLALQSRVLPPTTQTLRFGEAVRRALLSTSDGLAVFAGKDATGVPAVGHRHAYCLPYDQDDDGYLDHVVVFARGGLDEDALRAIERLTRLKGKNAARHPISVHLESRWGPSDAGQLDGLRPGLLRMSERWHSATPMVLPRFPKLTHGGRARLNAEGEWMEGPIVQAHRAFDNLGLPPREILLREREGVAIAGSTGRATPWFKYDRRRASGAGHGYHQQAFCFNVCFDKPVHGPMAIGYACHFGLGLFAPTR